MDRGLGVRAEVGRTGGFDRVAVTRPHVAKYLLSGFVRCGVCGGSIVQSWQALKSVYRCWYNWSRGSAVCTTRRQAEDVLSERLLRRNADMGE